MLLANTLYPATGNQVKRRDDIEKAIEFLEIFSEILSLVLFYDNKVKVCETYEIRILK